MRACGGWSVVGVRYALKLTSSCRLRMRSRQARLHRVPHSKMGPVNRSDLTMTTLQSRLCRED